MLATVARLGVTANDELLPEFDFQLEPGSRSDAWFVTRIHFLGDQPLPPFAPRLLEHLVTAAGKRIGNANAITDQLSDALDESLAARCPRLAEENVVAIPK